MTNMTANMIGNTAEVRYDDPSHAAQAVATLSGSLVDGAVIAVGHAPGSDTKVLVTGLSPATQWQDLKDYFKQVGHVRFCDVNGAGGRGPVTGGMMGGGFGGGRTGVGGMGVYTYMGSGIDVEGFLRENGVDERAANALRELPPAAQHEIVARGSLRGAQNPSSALMVRIKGAGQGPVMGGLAAGWGSGDGMMGQGMGAMGVGAMGMGAMGVGGGSDAEIFIAENMIDDRAANAFRQLPREVRYAVMALGPLQNAHNPSSALMVRIRSAQGTAGAVGTAAMGVAAAGMGGGGSAMRVGGGSDAERFVRENMIDEKAASALRQQPPALQYAVMSLGSLQNASNPSSALMVRIRNARGATGAAGAEVHAKAAGVGAMGRGSDVENFVAENMIDDKAANSLRQSSPDVQAFVMAAGSLQNASNPSSALMVRIRNAQGGCRSAPY